MSQHGAQGGPEALNSVEQEPAGLSHGKAGEGLDAGLGGGACWGTFLGAHGAREG